MLPSFHHLTCLIFLAFNSHISVLLMLFNMHGSEYAKSPLNKFYLDLQHQQTQQSLAIAMPKPHNKSTIEHVGHVLNSSKTKAAYSFQKTERFVPNKSFSPSKYYDLPSAFVNRSVSPQHSLRSTFAPDATFSPWKYNLSTSLDGKATSQERSITTFGIGREQYYKGRSDSSHIGPGAYTVRTPIQPKIYMGKRLHLKNTSKQPDCTSYNVTAESYNKLSTSKNNGSYRMKVEYYPKSMLQPYDNKIPGPGSYNAKLATQASKNTSYRQNFYRKKANSSFGVGQRLKTQSNLTPAPDFYNRFSEFGRPKC